MASDLCPVDRDQKCISEPIPVPFAPIQNPMSKKKKKNIVY